MMSAQDKLKALLASKKKAPAVSTSVPIVPTKSVPEQGSQPIESSSPSTQVPAVVSAADKLAAIRAKKASTKTALVQVPTESQVPEVADPIIEGVITKFQATDEMYQIDGFDPDLFMDNLEKLNAEIEAKAPGIGEYMQGIHRNLSKYPELMHLLEDDQIAVVVSGLLKQTNTELAIKATKTRSTKKSTPITIQMAEELF